MASNKKVRAFFPSYWVSCCCVILCRIMNLAYALMQLSKRQTKILLLWFIRSKRSRKDLETDPSNKGDGTVSKEAENEEISPKFRYQYGTICVCASRRQ